MHQLIGALVGVVSQFIIPLHTEGGTVWAVEVITADTLIRCSAVSTSRSCIVMERVNQQNDINIPCDDVSWTTYNILQLVHTLCSW